MVGWTDGQIKETDQTASLGYVCFLFVFFRVCLLVPCENVLRTSLGWRSGRAERWRLKQFVDRLGPGASSWSRTSIRGVDGESFFAHVGIVAIVIVTVTRRECSASSNNASPML